MSTAYLSTQPPDDWRKRSLCSRMVAEAYPEDRQYVAAKWYPTCADGQETLDHPEARRAAAICRECPVKTPCLEFALEHDLKHGIFAGTVPSQRKRMAEAKRRKRRELVTSGTR